jgi:hypothetical protein
MEKPYYGTRAGLNIICAYSDGLRSLPGRAGRAIRLGPFDSYLCMSDSPVRSILSSMSLIRLTREDSV